MLTAWDLEILAWYPVGTNLILQVQFTLLIVPGEGLMLRVTSEGQRMMSEMMIITKAEEPRPMKSMARP